ncbi:flagellar biosynthetic protein FliR [Roseibacterium sp. SDUM158016]|uniref:flagellar biosynthetic protein FliR n=1 Tax=Roseicyclus sediminis TaxID=2980997 RepID=UPI0021CEF880|nr:flagellar biosynthetic protein FliR [Roseibacterium sp. SDUM158016]MCU4654314.1 flagellar biosynthetic protein FliR [Roseibacterium sp. SDUM158016]
MDLEVFLAEQFLAFALVFARLGAALMFMPGFGEQAVPVRHRLIFALALSAAFMPVTPVGTMTADNPAQLFALLGIEIAVGLWIGLSARILLSALQFAGYQIGIVAGLANAFGPQLGSFEGSTMVASGLLMAGIALIFATDLHHVIIGALLMSYDVFPVGLIMPGDMANQIARGVSTSFWIAVSITAPFYVLGLLLNLALGLANKMLPTLPVFFVAVPVLIAAALLVLALSGPALFTGFLQFFRDWLATLSF